MSVLTVFLTVAFITLIDGLGGISAVPPLQMAISMGGDFDMIIGANMGRIKPIQKNLNYFEDEFDTFSARYMNERASQAFLTDHHLQSMNPFINYTSI